MSECKNYKTFMKISKLKIIVLKRAIKESKDYEYFNEIFKVL